MTNSQKEFEEWWNPVGLSEMVHETVVKVFAEEAWNKCNAMWERKLDEADLVYLIQREALSLANSNGDPHTLPILAVQAIIEYLKQVPELGTTKGE